MPATKAAMPNPASFVLRTLMPAAAAARSFERTASIRCPRLDRRTLATSSAMRMTPASTRKPKTGLGILSSRPRNVAFGERSIPPSFGCSTGDPAAWPPQRSFRNPNCSSATAAASVTTTRLTPRTRRAEMAMSSPTTVAVAAPMRSEIGNSAQIPPTSVVRCDIVKPATPASASCTTEICPTNPTMTTRERQIAMPSIELIVAWRKSYGNTISATTPSDRSDHARPQQPFRARNGRQPLLDELAAAGEARSPQEEREDDDEEDEELGQAVDRASPSCPSGTSSASTSR